MSNLPKALIVLALSFAANTAMADWRSDASHLDSDGGIGTTQVIDSVRLELNKYQPPQPCLDKDPKTFTANSPATLSCGGGAPSGGAASTEAPMEEQKGTGETFDHM